jgi:hypothetical protein
MTLRTSVSEAAFAAVAARLAPLFAAQNITLTQRGDIRQMVAEPGETGAFANLVWSARRGGETSRQMGTGPGADVVDFDRLFTLEIAVIAATADTSGALAEARADGLCTMARDALVGPGIDWTLGGAARFVSVEPAMDPGDTSPGRARIAARLLPVTTHLRAIGDPD